MKGSRYYVSGYFICDTVLKRSTAYGQAKKPYYVREHRRTYTGEDAIDLCEWLNEREVDYNATLHAFSL